VYVAAVEYSYLEDREDTCERYGVLGAGGDETYGALDEAKLALRTRWEDMLPLTRGFYDEAYVMNRVEELANYARSLEVELAAKEDALANVIEHEEQLERALATRRTARLLRLIRRRIKGSSKG
jgi:hypothetical protein